MSYNKEAEKDRKKGTWMLPATGFILIIALGVVSWFISDPVRDFLDQRLGTDLSGQQMQLVIALALFLVLVMFVGLLYAVLIPKRRGDVKDKDIAKERKEMERALLEKKERRRKVKRDMRK